MNPINVVLADDDSDDRLFFIRALKNIPFRTLLTTVQDGDELMKYLSLNTDHLPDILFLDLSMPRKTGFECLVEIKEDEKLKVLPVVVFTTSFGRGMHFEQGMINTLAGIGSLEYVSKSADIEHLEKTIHGILIKLIK